jgi:hypothetical protein
MRYQSPHAVSLSVGHALHERERHVVGVSRWIIPAA